MPNGKIRFAPILGLGAAIGFTPAQVCAMSIWEFNVAVGGWLRAHTPEDDKALTAEDEDNMLKLLEMAHGHRC